MFAGHKGLDEGLIASQKLINRIIMSKSLTIKRRHLFITDKLTKFLPNLMIVTGFYLKNIDSNQKREYLAGAIIII